MKKVYTLLLLLTGTSFCVSAQSPTPKGSFFVGGGISYSQTKSEQKSTSGNITQTIPQDDFSSIAITPRIGYMITNNFAVGLGIGYQRDKTKEFNSINGQSTGDITESLTTLSPFIRYYIGLNDKVSFFGEASGGFGFGNIEVRNITTTPFSTTTTVTEGDLSLLDVSIRPGINVFITDRLAFEGTIGRIGYTSSKSKVEEVEIQENNFEFGITPSSFSLGIFYWFK